METKPQIEAKIDEAIAMVEAENKKYPCRDNSLVITKLQEALHWLNQREFLQAKLAKSAAAEPVPELLTEQQPQNEPAQPV